MCCFSAQILKNKIQILLAITIYSTQPICAQISIQLLHKICAQLPIVYEYVQKSACLIYAFVRKQIKAIVLVLIHYTIFSTLTSTRAEHLSQL